MYTTFSKFIMETVNKIDDKILLAAITDATGIRTSFIDKFVKECSLEDASEIAFGVTLDGEYVGKYIKLPKNKSLVTVDWCVQKIAKDNIYKSFVDDFKKLLSKRSGTGFGMEIYPTTYGIGVFSFNGSKGKEIINELLDNIGIDYKEEWSDARYVYRYKISKSSENIKKIKTFIEDNN